MVTIPTIDQISGTTVMNKMRSLIHNYIDFGTEVAGELSYMMNVIENLPQDITDVYNKATIDAMFANVYQKSETYSKTEVNNLISTIGSFHAVIVDSLPTYGDEGVIYLVQIASAGDNRYEEYIWVNRWELIGQLSNVDLANYYTKTESDNRYYTKTESDNKFMDDSTAILTVTPLVEGMSVYSSSARKVGRTVYCSILFGNSDALNDCELFRISSSTAVVKQEGSVFAQILNYNAQAQRTAFPGRKVGTDTNKEQTYIVPNDITLSAGTWSLTFSYPTIE